jgi:hypothetical protein
MAPQRMSPPLKRDRQLHIAAFSIPCSARLFRSRRHVLFLKNGGSLENAAAMANHASTRTTQLYDRRRDAMSLDEVERISI